MPYTYDFPHPAVTVDAIPLMWRDGQLQVLLIRRGKPPFEGKWAFPGGFVEIDEDLEPAAARELGEETGLDAGHLEQLGAFGQPDRDPRERVITVAFLAPLSADHAGQPAAATDAAATAWHSVEELPRLAFDHAEIMAVAIERLMGLLRTTPFALYFMPETFRFQDVSALHESYLGQKLPKGRWNDWLSAGLISEAEDGRYSICVDLELNEL